MVVRLVAKRDASAAIFGAERWKLRTSDERGTRDVF
jgi:hypothetical protein